MVKAWRESVIIPTYEVGKAEKAPIFLEKRVYQGSSGVVYPYPVIESVADGKKDVEYKAIWLENEYIKVMILPELGGRIQMAYDKIKKRHFVYYNHVIKPALVGLAGPWISGGIEFNWPQHHRPSTFMPVDSDIQTNDDGSITVWVNEMERMFHQKGMAGFTLRPGCAYLEIKGALSNRTPMPQTFLWWANPAVAVNDYYQSVFPQDVNAVFDHGKRAVSSFPIATGTYYKMDYSAGVDISNYRNIKVPTSYMAVNSKYDFEGGYENDSKGGMLHVASHHVSPGKKQWTWGNGDFGRAWDRNLTDEDGPYIELMAGVYTENQPDFTWLMPYEEKRFTQYFMPYRELGIVKNATKDVVFNITHEGDKFNTKILATSKMSFRIRIKADSGEVLYDNNIEATPEKVIDILIDDHGFNIDTIGVEILNSEKSKRLLTWHAEEDVIRPIPDAAEAALQPQEIKTTEQLYLTGLHLEQYRHATYNPVDYYEEALRRDPLDYRCNNALGLWYIRKCRFEKAEQYLRTAVKVLKRRNPNPHDGEPIYNLALALLYQGKKSEAYELFWKSTWNKAWADAGYYNAALISSIEGRYDDALEEVEKALVFNTHNHQARALKAMLLEKMGKKDESISYGKESLSIDRFNYGCLFLLNKDKLVELMHGNAYNYHELALEFMHGGLYKESIDVLDLSIKNEAVTPMTYYYKAWVMALANYSDNECVDTLNKAESMARDYCFPNRQEDVLALEYAIHTIPNASSARYYLGCLYYDKRQYDEAEKYWMTSKDCNPSDGLVWRNLALLLYNKRNDKNKAYEYMQKAFELMPTSRLLMELSQLQRSMNIATEERLLFLEKHDDLVKERDDLMVDKSMLLNLLGRYDEARALIDSRKFHPWEGGEGKVSFQYQYCRVEKAKQLISAGQYDEALELLNQCLVYPENLGEGKLENAQDNDFHFFKGLAYSKKGDDTKARECWEEAVKGPQEPAAAMYYNDAKPDKIFYQGMALHCLGRDDEARGRYYKLINYGKNHYYNKVVMDYFAVSLPDLQIWEGSLDKANRIHCAYMLALGYYGLGDVYHAEKYLDEVMQLDSSHQGGIALKQLMKS